MPPVNLSAVTALDLGALPASVTQSDIRDGTTVHAVWYKITVPAGVEVLGVFGFGNLTAGATGYKPAVSVYLGPPEAPVAYPAEWPIGVDNVPGVNVPIQVPVTPGETYYLQFSTTTTDANPAVLTLSADAAPTADVPTGSLLINDDQTPFPAAFLSEADGSVLRFRTDHPAGEGGALLRLGSGAYALSDEAHPQVAIVGPDLIRRTTLAFGASALSTNQVDRFYAATGASPAIVRTFDEFGVAGPATWTLTGSGDVLGIGVNPAGTILYYVSFQTKTTLQRWDLVANASLGTFATASAGYDYDQRDLLVLDDGSLLASQTHTASGAGELLHYSPAGALLTTFPLGTVLQFPETRLAYALDAPVSVWVYLHPASGLSRFQRIRVSDGAVLASFDAIEFEAGVYARPQTATPVRFGHSKSCPLLVLTQAVVTPPEPSGGACPATFPIDTPPPGGSCATPLFDPDSDETWT